MKNRVIAISCVITLLALVACNIAVPTPTLAPVPLPTPLPSPGGPVGWLTYTDTYIGFTIQYPPDATLYLEAMTRIDFPILPDTNLGEKYLQIEYGSAASPCLSPLGAGYTSGSIPQTPLTINGINFVQEQGADAGAGNIYQWVSYSVAGSSGCVSLEFILHSTNPAMYDSPPAEFDYALESGIFTQVMDTFHWLP
ncbi:MAG: hypothetical protein HY781_13020 [Chloroflexi bacterium]|nr:hypothetical protein [Chloroflexota bacterium]